MVPHLDGWWSNDVYWPTSCYGRAEEIACHTLTQLCNQYRGLMPRRPATLVSLKGQGTPWTPAVEWGALTPSFDTKLTVAQNLALVIPPQQEPSQADMGARGDAVEQAQVLAALQASTMDTDWPVEHTL